MSKGQMNDMFKQMEELFSKVDKLNAELKSTKCEHEKEMKKIKEEHKREIKNLQIQLADKDNQIEKLTVENNKLKLEIERMKNQNKKDSSNSNKPSGTNGFREVITNRREKSDKKQGGQERSYWK